jgi:hypothetical protein
MRGHVWNIHSGLVTRRLLTGWSLVRIRPGEPNKINKLIERREGLEESKCGLGQHLGQQVADFIKDRRPTLPSISERSECHGGQSTFS